MKNVLRSSLLFLLALSLIYGCAGKGGNVKQEESVATDSPVIDNETLLMLKDLEENGDYVNSQFYPSLIKASVVREESAGRNLVIDLREKQDFSRGHIKGAVNKGFGELPAYFESGIKPFEYDRIVLVCKDGQLSGYATSLLRLMGYGNVFAMRWGMSAWNRDLARESWLSGVSGRFENALDTVTGTYPQPSGMPELSTGLATGKEISEARFKSLFGESATDFLISAEDVFAAPDKYFIINLERKDKYEDGHIPGAVRYKPESTLGFTDAMSTIPHDRPVVVYCGTGHNSAFATAYLRLFGYDARTLRYGNNSFMHDRMVARRAQLSWLPFTLEESNDFELVK